MTPKIESLFIKNFFDSYDVFWKLKDVNVLVGKNGAGKSTILQLIKNTVINEYDFELLNTCEGVQVAFENLENKEKNTLFSPKILNEGFADAYIQANINKLKDEFSKLNNVIKDEIDSTIKNEINAYIVRENLLAKNIDAILLENKVKMKVEYISTINMTANSTNNVRKSDGRTASFLDYEIKDEFNKLLLSKNSEQHKIKLINSLNRMFEDSNKEVQIDDNSLLFKLKNNKLINYSSLSSGERQIIYIFIKVLIASDNNALILMDEPEISLHLSWQENLISEIRSLNSTSQIIIVTHSPAIVMNGWMNSFVDIKDIIEKK